MRKIYLMAFVAIFLVASTPAFAVPKCLSIKNKIVNGKVRSTPRLLDTDGSGNCPAKSVKIATEETTVPESIVVGYAKTETAANPTIRSFGGSRVTSASVTGGTANASTGFYVVTLVGSFDSTDTYDTLGVQCTTNASGDCNAFISNDTTTASTPNSIEVGVQTYATSGGAATDAEVVVTVFKGKTP